MAAAEPKPLCKFGENCYRKNPQHLKQFRHPKRKQQEDEVGEASFKKKKKPEGNKKTIEDFFGKKKTAEHQISDDEEEKETKSTGAEKSPRKVESDVEFDTGSDEIEDTPPASPADVKDNIKQKFLVEMPQDFYEFWEFCKSEKPERPVDALKKLLDLQLVGPFDILAGKHEGVIENRHGKRPNFLLHWRYYYDPPEFQTVIKGDDATQFHMGYFRDDPQEMPVFVAANAVQKGCKIEAKGENLFAAVSFFIDEKIKSKDTDSSKKEKLKEMLERLKDWATKHKFSIEPKTKRMKERDKKVVCKTFHGAGIVVPVDENEVGYREVPETPGDLKKMFKKIADSKTEAERDKNYEALQELVTLVQFANDECDYGEGLELGMDLFCYGGSVFHSTISQLLPLAYMLLKKPEFQKIIEVHLKKRSKGSDLSQLT